MEFSSYDCAPRDFVRGRLRPGQQIRWALIAHRRVGSLSDLLAGLAEQVICSRANRRNRSV
jgi:hypothetical protein